MRTYHRVLLATGAAALAFAAPRPARADIDVDPPLPNVLLLIDTSGSMEYLLQRAKDGTDLLPGDPSVPGSACSPGGSTTQMNRWATLVSVLTGDITNFSCKKTPRDGPFSAEYSLLGVPPYDAGYYLPFHRLLSDGCTPGPGVVPSNYWDWPAGAINYHDHSNPKNACSTPWTQSNNGILDTYRDRARFSMMTFDTLSDAGVGTAGNALDGTTGMNGMWSYYAGWTSGSGNYKKGNPPNCAITPFEVGARNQAAPPWEGRLIPFGPGDAALLDVETTNDHIQEALIAMRPYGATPIAGMFDDAQEFLLNDSSTDPSTGKPFGPKGDAYVQGGCRKTFVILLSDGEPNMDLMPDCAQAGGSCPYKSAADTALALASLPGSQQVLTYVLGMSLSDSSALGPLGLQSCNQLDFAKNCANPPAGLKACCELTRIASSGGTQHAYFADDQVSMKEVLSQILATITAGSTARTIPVFSGISALSATAAKALQGNAPAAGYRFIARFKADASGSLWSGDLERQRYTCEPDPKTGSLVATLNAPDVTKGDDFSKNLDQDDPLRRFFTFTAPSLNTGQIRSDWTLRPKVTTDDGLGLYATGQSVATTLRDGTSFASYLSTNTQILGIDPITPPAPCSTTLKTNSAAACVDQLVRWEVGEASQPLSRKAPAVCPPNTKCTSPFGAIYHSTPAVIGPPREQLSDSTYGAFAVQAAGRPIMLYTATTDGQLHAFKIAASAAADTDHVDKLSTNELWSFLPPIVMPGLLSSYNQQSLLVDGAPVVGDVVFERKRGQAPAWNTVLVGGGGDAGGFYYALDVTDPTKPVFLWQLSTDMNNQRLFGRTTPTPAIATVTLPDGADVKEVAVAILPGGTASAVAGSCLRDNTGTLMNSNKFAPRTSVRCWGPGAARSLSVVRLDTGEVLMNFRGALGDGPSGMVANKKVVPFSSPITGTPVPYPAQTGQVADRVYIGDADGALWRVDLSSSDPQKWKVSLAWDAYSSPGDTADSGQLSATTPVISTDPYGNVVILYSTGDQDLLTPSASMVTRLWSLSEMRDPVKGTFNISQNWNKSFLGGERVTGPMGLFSGTLYFSSFSPATSGAVCSFGASAVWALDYLTGAGRFPIPNSPTFKESEAAPDTIIFGVAVTQTPTCVSDASSTDPYFGTHDYVTGASGGTYQVIWNKGPGNGVVNNTAVKTDASTGIQSLDLLNPLQATKIDSWAGIIE